MDQRLESPTDRWLAVVPQLPALASPGAQTAERLVLLLHYGVDWSDANWVGARRGDYWESLLPSRIRLATYRCADLHGWWTVVSGTLGSVPRTATQRMELASLLAEPSRPVLQVLRDQTSALTLRARIVADAVRQERAEGKEPSGG